MTLEAERLHDREAALLDRIEHKATFLADLDDQMHRTAKEIDEYRILLGEIRAQMTKVAA